MNARYIIVDGMLSGTGIRDLYEGGYIPLQSLGLSADLILSIQNWLARYEAAHYDEFSDSQEVKSLDEMGISLSKLIKNELPDAKVEYYSHALGSKC
jgi:hypothetical protein